jgi:Maltokinase N-terminal cap domain
VAIIHRASIRPTKLELVTDWLPSRPWCTAETPSDLESVGAYRFDDPDGEVGMETLLVRSAGGRVFQVPLTYRGEPLVGAEQSLITTMEHTVLGRRWVYDACGDPTYAAVLAATILGGGTEAEELVQVDGRSVPRASTASVRGSGTPGTSVRGFTGPVALDELTTRTQGVLTELSMPHLVLVVARVIDPVPGPIGDGPAGGHTLTGTWATQQRPVVLATARVAEGSSGALSA